MTTDADSTLLESESGEPIASTHTSTRMSAQIQRIEVITRTEKRRRWSAEEKQAIVAESIAGAASITSVARKHGIGTGQLYSWRHQLLKQRPASACFAQVAVTPQAGPLSVPPTPGRIEPGRIEPGRIEIVLPGAIRLLVDAQVDAAALRRVLAVLRG
jgi:transposase